MPLLIRLFDIHHYGIRDILVSAINSFPSARVIHLSLISFSTFSMNLRSYVLWSGYSCFSRDASNGFSFPAIKQKESPVEAPDQIEVGASIKGERTPPVTFPNWSITGLPFSTRIGSACGAGIPVRTHSTRLCHAALKPMLLGKRLRGPSLQFIGGTDRPALMMSAGAAENWSSSGVARPMPTN